FTDRALTCSFRRGCVERIRLASDRSKEQPLTPRETDNPHSPATLVFPGVFQVTGTQTGSRPLNRNDATDRAVAASPLPGCVIDSFFGGTRRMLFATRSSFAVIILDDMRDCLPLLWGPIE